MDAIKDYNEEMLKLGTFAPQPRQGANKPMIWEPSKKKHNLNYSQKNQNLQYRLFLPYVQINQDKNK